MSTSENLIYRLTILTSYIGNHPCPEFDHDVTYFSDLEAAEFTYVKYQKEEEPEDIHTYSGNGSSLIIQSAPVPQEAALLAKLLNGDTLKDDDVTWTDVKYKTSLLYRKHEYMRYEEGGIAKDDITLLDLEAFDKKHGRTDEVYEPEAEEGKVLVIMKDPQGMTRAWARGDEGMLESIKKYAEQQLAEYREKKRELSDPLADAEYTMHIEHGRTVEEEGATDGVL